MSENTFVLIGMLFLLLIETTLVAFFAACVSHSSIAASTILAGGWVLISAALVHDIDTWDQ
jgi:hypothetical protein